MTCRVLMMLLMAPPVEARAILNSASSASFVSEHNYYIETSGVAGLSHNLSIIVGGNLKWQTMC